MGSRTGKVWANPRATKRKRFIAMLEVNNDFLPYRVRKTFSTRMAAADWLTQRRVATVRQF